MQNNSKARVFKTLFLCVGKPKGQHRSADTSILLFFVRVNVIKKYYSNNNFSKQLFKKVVKYTAALEINGGAFLLLALLKS